MRSLWLQCAEVGSDSVQFVRLDAVTTFVQRRQAHGWQLRAAAAPGGKELVVLDAPEDTGHQDRIGELVGLLDDAEREGGARILRVELDGTRLVVRTDA